MMVPFRPPGTAQQVRPQPIRVLPLLLLVCLAGCSGQEASPDRGATSQEGAGGPVSSPPTGQGPPAGAESSASVAGLGLCEAIATDVAEVTGLKPARGPQQSRGIVNCAYSGPSGTVELSVNFFSPPADAAALYDNALRNVREGVASGLFDSTVKEFDGLGDRAFSVEAPKGSSVAFQRGDRGAEVASFGAVGKAGTISVPLDKVATLARRVQKHV